MEFKGTKGKWTLGDKRKGYQFIDCRESSWYEMVRVVIQVSKKTSIEGKANALLISKAPEMLHYLSGLLEDLKRGVSIQKEDIQILEQLIKEATEL